MKKIDEWLFPSSLDAAKQTQKELAHVVVQTDDFSKKISYIAGLDVSNNPFDPKKMIYAAVVVLSYPDLKLVEVADCAEEESFRYVSGFLGFREAPPLLKAFKKLKITPDLLFVDGHGVSHPRGLGIASHFGVLLDLPTIGVAKSILVGAHESLGEEIGSQTFLHWKHQVIGSVVRTKKRCSPLIISSGHRVSLPSAVDWVFNCLKKYRLPEPIRYAHQAANDCRRR